jgi:hypothetical protein
LVLDSTYGQRNQPISGCESLQTYKRDNKMHIKVSWNVLCHNSKSFLNRTVANLLVVCLCKSISSLLDIIVHNHQVLC